MIRRCSKPRNRGRPVTSLRFTTPSGRWVILPVEKSSLLPLVIPLALPPLAAGAIEIPLAELVGKVFKHSCNSGSPVS